MLVFSANARRSSHASACRMPCPASMTGRFALAISVAAVLSCRPWPSRLGRKPGSPAMTSASDGCSARVSCWSASFVMSMWTGPGRPVRAMWNDLMNRGYYEPTAGIRWGAAEIVAYIKTTIA